MQTMRPMPKAGPQSWLSRLVMALTLSLALVAGIFLSAIFFALFMVLALIGIVWFWWQNRKLRHKKTNRSTIDGDIVEVEYQVLEEHHSYPTPEADHKKRSHSSDE